MDSVVVSLIIARLPLGLISSPFDLVNSVSPSSNHGCLPVKLQLSLLLRPVASSCCVHGSRSLDAKARPTFLKNAPTAAYSPRALTSALHRSSGGKKSQNTVPVTNATVKGPDTNLGT